MTLDELITTIENSDASDWQHIHRPIFAQDMTQVSGGNNQRPWIEIKEHYSLLVYEKDLSISIAKGMSENNDFREKWANQFADPKASSSWIDFRYNGVPVLREMSIHVDGARAELPLPSAGTLNVPERQARVWGLLDRIAGTGRYDDYFKRAGLVETATNWP